MPDAYRSAVGGTDAREIGRVAAVDTSLHEHPRTHPPTPTKYPRSLQPFPDVSAVERTPENCEQADQLPAVLGLIHTGCGGARKYCMRKMERIFCCQLEYSHSIASNIKGFARKSASASCVNWAFARTVTYVLLVASWSEILCFSLICTTTFFFFSLLPDAGPEHVFDRNIAAQNLDVNDNELELGNGIENLSLREELVRIQ